MTGNELAKAIGKVKGKISIGMVTPDEVPFIYAEKADLIRWAKAQGEQETKMTLEADGSAGTALVIDYGVRCAFDDDEDRRFQEMYFSQHPDDGKTHQRLRKS